MMITESMGHDTGAGRLELREEGTRIAYSGHGVDGTVGDRL
jgi:hypothetical protein